MRASLRTLTTLTALIVLSTNTLLADSAFEGTQGNISRTSLGLYGGEPEDMVISPNGNVFVGLNSANGIFCTTDGAATWTAPPEGSDLGATAGIAVGETNTTLYVIGGIDLYKSSDACQTYTQLQGPGGSNDFGQAIAYGHDVLVVAFRDGTVAVSDDYGSTFASHEVAADVTNIAALAASPTADTFYALATREGLDDNYLYGSTDGGETWTYLNKSGSYSEVAVDPLDAQRIVLAGNSGAEVSNDTTASWNDLNPLGAIRPSIAFWDGKICISASCTEDDGTSWDTLPPPGGDSDSGLMGYLVIDPTDSSTAYIGSARGVAKTTDSGTTWTDSVEGMLGVQVYDIAQSANKDTVYITATGGVAKSTNFTDETNRSFTYPLSSTGAGRIDSILILDPSDPDGLVGGGPNGLYYSSDGASSWTEATSPLSGGAVLTNFAQLSNGNLVVGYNDSNTHSGGVLQSTDNGQTWTDMSMTNSPPANTVLAIDNTIFVGVGNEFDSNSTTNKGIYYHDGTSWSQLTGDIDGYRIQDLIYNGTTIFAAGGETEGASVFRSEDSGATWEDLIANGLNNMEWYQTLAYDPNDPDTVFVASGRPAGTCYIFKTEDSGDSWSTHYTGLKDEVPAVMLVDDLTVGFDTGAYEFSQSEGSGGDGLSSPIYALWNGFLSMTNILELVNTGSSALDVTVTMYDISGTAGQPLPLQLAAQGQQDLILNSMATFSADSYGIVKIEFQGTDLDGRLSFYRNAPASSTGDAYEFAFAVPFENSLTGSSYVGFNTFQPSLNPDEATNAVTNWLSIVNLDTQQAKTFTVKRYSQTGTLLNTEIVEVPAFGRRDIDGGHGEGPSVVGYNEIDPSDDQAEYKALSVRYGPDAPAGQIASSYSFAFPLLAKSPGDAAVWAPISNGAGGQNWVEVVNTSDQTVTGTLSFYDNQGNEVLWAQQALELGTRAQTHVNASAVLPSGASGAASITTSGGAAIIAQSMFYFRDSAGSIEAMYGSQFLPTSTEVVGSWNLFLSMYNWLRVFNTGTSSANLTVTVYNNGQSTQKQVSLGAKSGTDLGIHEVANYGTSLDSYGLVEIDGNGANIIAELLRLKPTVSGAIDFAAPTKMR